MIDHDLKFVVKNFKSYKLSDSEVFFDFHAQEFIFPDEISRFYLDGLLSGEKLDSLVKAVSTHFKKPVDIIYSDLAKLLRSLHANSIVNHKSLFPNTRTSALECSASTLAVRGLVRISSQDICVGFSDIKDYHAWISSNYSTVEISSQKEVDIVLTNSGGARQIYTPHTKTGIYNCQTEALLMLRAYAEDIAAKRIAPSLVLHAGAVANHDNKAIVLPATGGSGKSTLVAGLASSGYTLIHDDVVPLDSNNHIHTLGPLVKLKPGSWPVIDEIRSQSTADSNPIAFGSLEVKTYRFDTENNTGPFSAKWLITPEYSKDSCASESKLSSLNALKTIIASDSLFRTPLDDEQVQGILDWVCSMECWKIIYPSMDDALRLVEKITK